MRKHNVVFLSPGSFVSEMSTKELTSWDVKEAVKIAETVLERHNAKPYGFQFETYLTHDDVPDGEGGFLKVQPRLVKSSGIHHLGGDLVTYDMVVERDAKDQRILKENMRSNEYWIVCINTNSWKSTTPFNENDVLVDDHGNIVERGDDPKYVAYRAEQKAKRDAEYAIQSAKWEAERQARNAMQESK